jgi:hypothetical protein
MMQKPVAANHTIATPATAVNASHHGLYTTDSTDAIEMLIATARCGDNEDDSRDRRITSALDSGGAGAAWRSRRAKANIRGRRQVGAQAYI